MNSLKRLIWCALVFGIQALYFPLNRFLKGGMEFKTAFDNFVPLWPVWVIPYMLICGWWLVAAIWAVARMEERLYEAFFIASAFVSVTALTIFTVFPTYVVRPFLPGTDWLTQLLDWVYSSDHMYNAFPSGHVYLPTSIIYPIPSAGWHLPGWAIALVCGVWLTMIRCSSPWSVNWNFEQIFKIKSAEVENPPQIL